MVSVDGALEVEVICGQGVAPMAATTARFAELGLDMVPGTGLLPAVVPGAFGAWTVLVERYGTWSLRDITGARYVSRGTRTSASGQCRNDDQLGRGALSSIIGLRQQQPGCQATECRRQASAFAIQHSAATYRRIVQDAEAADARPRGSVRGCAALVVSRLRRRGNRTLLCRERHSRHVRPHSPWTAHCERHGSLGAFD